MSTSSKKKERTAMAIERRETEKKKKNEIRRDSVQLDSLEDAQLSADFVTREFVEDSISAALSNYAPGGGGGGSGGFGTVTLMNSVGLDVGSNCGISVNGKTYMAFWNSNHAFSYASIYAVVVPENSTVEVFNNLDSGYNIVHKNGVEVDPAPNAFTIDSGDAYHIGYFFCLSPSTRIALASGGSVALSDLNVGDEIAAVDPETGKLGYDVVAEIHSGEGSFYDVWTFSDGTEVVTVGRHRFFDVDLAEMMYLEAWNLGERAFRLDGEKPSLVKREHFGEKHPHMTLFTEKWNNYFADGLLAGNRRSAKLPTSLFRK